MKIILVYSLGNMLVSAAKRDHGLQYAKYFMLNAAVAVEAYDAVSGVTAESRAGMTHPEWVGYPDRVRASHWWELFPDGDGRHSLTWRNFFTNVTDTVNYYSSEEEVLANGNGTAPNFPRREHAWSDQELWKGNKPITDVPVGSMGRDEGGWAFNPATMEWRHMKKTLTAADRTLTLEVPLAEGDSGLPRVLELVPLFDGVGGTCPVTVAANGSMVGTFDLMKADEQAILLRGEHARRNLGGNLVLTITRPEGCAGTLSFDALSLCGSWNVGAGDGVPPVLSWNDPALSLLFDIPKADIGIRGYRYRTKIASLVGRDHAVSLALNGVTVWTASSFSVNQAIDVNFGANDMKPGLNELTWHLDAIEANRSVSFDFHRLKMVPPPARTVFVIR